MDRADPGWILARAHAVPLEQLAGRDHRAAEQALPLAAERFERREQQLPRQPERKPPLQLVTGGLEDQRTPPGPALARGADQPRLPEAGGTLDVDERSPVGHRAKRRADRLQLTLALEQSLRLLRTHNRNAGTHVPATNQTHPLAV